MLKDSATLRKSEFMWILRFLMYVFLASSFLAAKKQASRSAKIAAVFSFRTYRILPCAYGKQNQKISLFHKLWCWPSFGVSPNKKRRLSLGKSPFKFWWAGWGLNPRPNDYESSALTAELPARKKKCKIALSYFILQANYLKNEKIFKGERFLFLCKSCA